MQKANLPPAPVIEDEYVPEYTLDPRGVSLSEKIRILDSYLDFILGYDKAITAAQIVYNEKISTIYFANSEGTYIKQEKLDIGSNMAATARRG